MPPWPVRIRVCDGTDTYTFSGDGSTDSYTGITGAGADTPEKTNVIVQDTAVISTGNSAAISLGSGTSTNARGEITIGTVTNVNPSGVTENTTVSNNAVSGDGKYPGAGKNTIEADSYYKITIGENAGVYSNGTESNAEAINLMGSGNNNLILDADQAGDTGVLEGAVRNFTTITKTGAGNWLIMGQVPITDPGDLHPSSPANILIDTELGAAGSETSVLHITGTVSGTPSWVNVMNQGGAGAMTDNGIQIIQVDGGGFRLKPDGYAPDGTAVVMAGDWGYSLNWEFDKGGAPGNNANWWTLNAYERADQIITPPNITVFDSVALAAAPFNLIGTLKQRVGNRNWGGLQRSRPYQDYASASSGNAYASPVSSDSRLVEQAGIWTRIEGAKVTLAPRTSDSHQGKSDIDFWRAELGVDMPIWRPSAGSGLILGVSGHFSGTKNDLKQLQVAGSRGEVKSRGFGAGATLTWYSEGGFYADAGGPGTNPT